MNIRDLRIGNLVDYDNIKSCYVVVINSKCFQDTFDQGIIINTFPSLKEINIKDAKPIPLTEEWLLDLGYKKRRKKSYYHPYTMGYELYNITALDGGFKIIAKRGTYILSKELKYVHDLQNYHHGCVGTDLEFFQ